MAIWRLMMAAESKLEKKCWNWALNEHGVTSIKTTPYRGYPDRMFMYKGHVFIVEFKAPGEPASKLQLQARKDLMINGFYVHVVDDFNVFTYILQAWVLRCDRKL
jgi:hypothetical protein